MTATEYQAGSPEAMSKSGFLSEADRRRRCRSVGGNEERSAHPEERSTDAEEQCHEWWRMPEAQARFLTWGVTNVIPPGEDCFYVSIFSGKKKYKAVTLEVPSEECKSKVTEQMDAYNLSIGAFHLFKVVVSGVSGVRAPAVSADPCERHEGHEKSQLSSDPRKLCRGDEDAHWASEPYQSQERCKDLQVTSTCHVGRRGPD